MNPVSPSPPAARSLPGGLSIGRRSGLRLLFVLHNFPTRSLAGTELYVLSMAQELLRRGHSVRIVYPDHDAARPVGAVVEESFEGVQTVRINLREASDLAGQFRNPEAASALTATILRYGADLVHFHHLIGFSASALSACADAGLPVVMTAHDGWLICDQVHFIRPDGSFCEGGPDTVDRCVQCFLGRHPGAVEFERIPDLFYVLALRRQFLRGVAARADALVAPSQFMRRMLAGHGVDHPLMVVSPLGLPPLPVLPRTPRSGPLRFAFIGGVYPTKGLDILVKAFHLRDPASAVLDIYGMVVDVPYFHACMEAVSPGHAVTWRGEYSPAELPAILAQTDVAVVPSRAESYSLVTRECLRAGVPVVGSRVGGIPEAVVDGVNGLLFHPGDSLELQGHLRRLAENPSLADTLRRRIGPVPTVSEDATRLESVYRCVPAAARRRG